MKYHRLFCLLVVGVVSAGLMGCATTKKTAFTDQDIANNIKAALESPAGPEGPFGIDIWVHKGSVTLDGEVPSQSSKEKAMQTAQSAEGTKDLKSFLDVK